MSEINITLNFSLDEIEIDNSINDKFFRRARIKAFASGENAHTLPIDEDVLKRGAKTVYDKPILYKYSKILDDVLGHEKDEVPCGFVPREDNPIRFVREDDGRVFLVIDALIWTKYSSRVVDIFERDGEKSVSIEIAITKIDERFSEKPKVLEFVIAGITILGELVPPAVKGCSAELIEFSKDVGMYYNFSNQNNMYINNSKEFAVTSEWENPRKKLYNSITNKDNASELISEVYLVNYSLNKNSSFLDHKYPHHTINNGMLVVHKDGLRLAFQKSLQDGITDEAFAHILKHYCELGLSADNYSTFGISDNHFDIYFKDIIKKESVGEEILAEEKKVDMGDINTEGVAQLEQINKEEEQHKEEAEIIEAETTVGEAFEDDKGEDKEQNFEDENEADKDDDNDSDDGEEKEELEEEMSFEDLKSVYSEILAKCSKLEEDNKAYMSQIETMSDYEELKKFKEQCMEEKAKEEDLSKMSEVISNIENKIEMSQTEKDELISKFSEFSNIDAWANFAKAYVFDKVGNKEEEIVKIDMPYARQTKTNSIWDKI